jgi:hypothetical protein
MRLTGILSLTRQTHSLVNGSHLTVAHEIDSSPRIQPVQRLSYSRLQIVRYLVSLKYHRHDMPNNFVLLLAELSGSVSAFSRYILCSPGTSNARNL